MSDVCGAPQSIWHGDGDPGVPIPTCQQRPGHEPDVAHGANLGGGHVVMWTQPGHLWPDDGAETVLAEGVDQPRAACTITDVKT